jgi:pyruvate dehydrogenase E1 component alpha subunit
MVAAMGLKVAEGTGSDLMSCNQIMKDAVNTVRTSQEPIFLEFSTYRWREHCGHNYDNDIGYRPQAEFLEWQARDPLSHLEKALSGSNPEVKLAVNAIKSTVNSELHTIFETAEAAPFPQAAEAFQNVYA